MRIDKKIVTKDDGRYLLYYHFPRSASATQTKAFESLNVPTEPVASSDGSIPVTPAGAADTPESEE